MTEPLHSIIIGENTVSIDSACNVSITSRGEEVTNVKMREAVLHLMLTQSMSAAVAASRDAHLTDDRFVVEYVTRKPHGPEATRVSIANMPDWARPLYDPATRSRVSFMGMDVVEKADMGSNEVAMVNCIVCSDDGIVHVGPNMDLCPATGCTARDKWRRTSHGWARKGSEQ